MLGFRKAKSTHSIFPRDSYTTSLQQKDLLLLVLFAFPCLSQAHQQGNFSDAYATADSQHNAAYSLALQRLTTSQQGLLMRADLAWSVFSDKEKALMNALQSENRITEDFAHSHSIDVVEERTNHLRAFFVDYKIDYPVQYTPQNRDEELNRVYAECLPRMTESNRGLLMASERAWITYRDADIDAVMATSPNRSVKDAVIVHLTLMRIGQLASLVQSVRQASIITAPAQDLPVPPLVQSNSPNPEDVKAVTEFQNDAKTVFNAFLAKKDDPFFKKADVIKNVPELSADISNQIAKLDVKYIELSRKPYSDKLLEPALNECAAIELLVTWSKFTQQVKAGSVVDAGLTIQRALDHKPKDITANYLPFWQAAGTWQDVFKTDEGQ